MTYRDFFPVYGVTIFAKKKSNQTKQPFIQFIELFCCLYACSHLSNTNLKPESINILQFPLHEKKKTQIQKFK